MLAKCILILAFLFVCDSAPAVEVPRTSQIVYSSFHFGLDIPVSSEKRVIPATNAELVHNIYISGDYAYTVTVLKPSDTLLASTAIETMIQRKVQSGSAQGPTKRWELDSQARKLFKGYTIIADTNKLALKNLFDGERCAQSVAMAPLEDELSAVLAIGVLGSQGKADDVESLAKYLAFTFVTISESSPVEASPQPIDVAHRNPSLLTTYSAPAYSTQPKSVCPALLARAQLRKGDIELTGIVKTVEGGKSLTMSVESIRLSEAGTTKLDSPRTKIVFVQELPSSVEVGKRITVVGANDGVGTPIVADTIRFTEGL